MKFLFIIELLVILNVFANAFAATNDNPVDDKNTNDIRSLIKEKTKEEMEKSSGEKAEDVVIGSMLQVERDDDGGYLVYTLPLDYYTQKIERIKPKGGNSHSQKPFQSLNREIRQEILGIFVKYVSFKDVVCIMLNSGKKTGYFVFARTSKDFTLREYYFK